MDYTRPDLVVHRNRNLTPWLEQHFKLGGYIMEYIIHGNTLWSTLFMAIKSYVIYTKYIGGGSWHRVVSNLNHDPPRDGR